jgi:hypothetical protein
LGETAHGIGPQAFPGVKASLGEQLDGVHLGEYLPNGSLETRADLSLGFGQREQSIEAVKTSVGRPAMPACRPCFQLDEPVQPRNQIRGGKEILEE